MKSFLEKRWVGPLFLLLYAVGISFFIVQKITPHIKEAFPVITQEVANFLPITFQNGEIIKPENTVIHKVYSEEEENALHIILDTRTDTLNLNKLPKDGIYMSKKCLYVVSPDESKIKCFDSIQSPEPFVIDEELVKTLINKAEKYMGGILISFLSICIFIVLYLVILFYTIIMHWIIALSTKSTFGQTLFVNTFLYIICNLLEITTPINISFILKLVLFIALNLIICKSINKKTAL